MKRRKWEAKTNAALVVQGLQGKLGAKRCTEHQSSQAQYDQWRDQLLPHAGQACDVHQQSQRATQLQQETARLQQVVGEVPLQLQKHDEGGGMRRQAPASVTERHATLCKQIEVLKAKHPFWGDRRVWAHLRFTDGRQVNRKRGLRLMRAHNWLVPVNPRLRANRTPTRSKPKPHRPNQWWGIAMTTVLVEAEGCLSIVQVFAW